MWVVDAVWCEPTLAASDLVCVLCLLSRDASVDARFTVVQEVECVLMGVMFVQLSQYFYLNKQKNLYILQTTTKKKWRPLNGDGLICKILQL